MTAQKHTSGPWSITTDAGVSDICTVYNVTAQPTEDGIGQEWVYITHERHDGEGWVFPDKAERLANARLIAAAPDMLEALKDLVSFFEKTGFSSEFLNDARSVIEKAEGQT